MIINKRTFDELMLDIKTLQGVLKMSKIMNQNPHAKCYIEEIQEQDIKDYMESLITRYTSFRNSLLLH